MTAETVAETAGAMAAAEEVTDMAGRKHQVKISSKRGCRSANRKYRRQEKESLKETAVHGKDFRARRPTR
jgi:hypothetical protein